MPTPPLRDKTHSRSSWFRRNPLCNPEPGGDAVGLPPTLIQVGSDEVLADDSLRMAARLKAARCKVEIEVWPRMPHAWHLYARILPEGREAIARAGRFLQSVLAASHGVGDLTHTTVE